MFASHLSALHSVDNTDPLPLVLAHAVLLSHHSRFDLPSVAEDVRVEELSIETEMR